jgi:microcystin-dependent protein
MDPTLAEIRWFAGNFAPRFWAFCSGQLLPIAQNTALFSLLGTTFGGNGTTTFALPDFRGRVPVGTGQGPGLSLVNLGERAGSPSVTLLSTNLPAHNHGGTLQGSSSQGTSVSPTDARPATTNDATYSSTAAPVTIGGLQAASVVGSNQPVSIMQPYLGMNYIIALEGIYPSRN